MDPEATLLEILKLCEDVGHVDSDTATQTIKNALADSLQDLCDFLRSGGFTPDSLKVATQFLQARECVVLNASEVEAVAETCEEHSAKAAAIVRGLVS